MTSGCHEMKWGHDDRRPGKVRHRRSRADVHDLGTCRLRTTTGRVGRRPAKCLPRDRRIAILAGHRYGTAMGRNTQVQRQLGLAVLFEGGAHLDVRVLRHPSGSLPPTPAGRHSSLPCKPVRYRPCSRTPNTARPARPKPKPQEYPGTGRQQIPVPFADSDEFANVWRLPAIALISFLIDQSLQVRMLDILELPLTQRRQDEPEAIFIMAFASVLQYYVMSL